MTYKKSNRGIADNLKPALLDRLTDNFPKNEKDTLAEVFMSRKKLRKIIMRDLSFLLNATNANDMDDILGGFPFVKVSSLNYGLPAFSGKRASDVKLKNLEEEIRQAIGFYEPRIIFETLTVKGLSSSDQEASHNMVIFEIRGQIWAEPYPIEMLLRSSVDLETGAVALLDQLGEN